MVLRKRVIRELLPVIFRWPRVEVPPCFLELPLVQLPDPIADLLLHVSFGVLGPFHHFIFVDHVQLVSVLGHQRMLLQLSSSRWDSPCCRSVDLLVHLVIVVVGREVSLANYFSWVDITKL